MHYFSGKGCSEFLESMHYCIGILNMQREDFSNRRNYEREFRTVSANIDMILGKSYEQEQQIEKEQNL